MKVQQSRMRWMLGGAVLLVCCVALWGCESWRAMHATNAPGQKKAKHVSIWREGQNIYESKRKVKVKRNEEYVHWTCYERFQIDYKKRDDYSQPVCTDKPDTQGGLYRCSSQVFPMKDVFDYKITIFPSQGAPISKDPVIEVLD